MKESILNLLRENNDTFLSGQLISEKLKVSRTAIWKYINILRNEGYRIDSSPKKGYKLMYSPDILTYDEIKCNLHTNCIGKNFFYFDSINSTNMKAKELAEKGESHGTVVVSEEQTIGHGRLGRTWISPKYKGIWLSIILRPQTAPVNVPKITQIAAAAVITALNELEIDGYVKWPNDIIINHKKVCGILTEMSGELNMVNYVVVGMGVNVNLDKCDFKGDISNKASSLKIETGSPIDRKLLLALIMNKFENLYNEFEENLSIKSSISICKEHSAVLGRDIKIIFNGKEYFAKAIDIGENGELIVKYPDGSIKHIISGEISIRALNGYI
ncbi:MAG: biotin--[acetyl-CoA-carboxylase] ligase [Clostridium sp.]|jgi:BirA family biotin operon repressor/biotin-[acetyl-CoA-carboxylase] ligase|uniref:biotin--[acetyl-CoA-carboxylase] ligase n=1 Tax=Clostridium sp. TaxID=1506 RepID=UPI0025B88581|nr:biotin--[acetyl-CoA-carboxylase] ligase [Clostridium sp.]MCH3963168.1 biotin--[acetyl-CoA-carboxylase] ligase [Clostridium sp.]MCI1716369.1 biotin--[acetyl-CoA-carboxylase] ligase [Clostridium sp.]MCI1800709.1 biotin--[acetyl-CoA-carboxylase] ligase [Clostridium sp.]MCI1814636.1 biotin--[acetyl-CoA-carboxylase] ligase [Clostridium sp.]MCI1871546.1 biotin--[acetyl-CoA-carboxylase] ligase [Clostridium sp.]